MDKTREPLIHITKRGLVAPGRAWAIRILSILAALLVCAIVTTMTTGINPLAVFGAIFEGAFGTSRKIWMLLQNIHVPGTSQPMAVALELARTMLEGCGAWRVHGGGFAGTTLNFVPEGMTDEFVRKMEQVFDTGCCFVVDVRPVGPALSHMEPENGED